MARTRSIKFPNSLTEWEALFDKLQRRACNMVFNSAGLAIKAGTSALAKSVNTITVIIDDVIVQKAAADMAALGGSVVADGSKNVYVFCVDAAGTLTTLNGTPAATLAAITWPTVPDGVAVVGFLIVANGTGSNFTPGTTALDTASLTTTYVNTPFAFFPGLSTL